MTFVRRGGWREMLATHFIYKENLAAVGVLIKQLVILNSLPTRRNSLPNKIICEGAPLLNQYMYKGHIY